MGIGIEGENNQTESDRQKNLSRLLEQAGELLHANRQKIPDYVYDQSCRIDSASPMPPEIASDDNLEINGSRFRYSRIVFNNLVIIHNRRERRANPALVRTGYEVKLESGQFKEFSIPDAQVAQAISNTLEEFTRHFEKERKPSVWQRLKTGAKPRFLTPQDKS